MAGNRTQFQKGMSIATFYRLYGTQEQCHEALVKMRWPDGFVCPHCGGRHHSFCKPKRAFQCSACRRQTLECRCFEHSHQWRRWAKIFHRSQTPLTEWFLAMYPMTTAKNDVAALELMRHLDVTWDTACGDTA